MTRPEITAGTRLVALLGHPVAHSVSPQIHNAAFAEAAVAAVYVAADVAPADLATAVAGLRALGALGANVTVPHKRAALELADVRSAEADAVGAANTLWWQDGRLHADNTDAAGLALVLDRDVGLRRGDAVVLYGAGGAARAAAVALGRAGARVAVVARRADAAAAVAALAAACGASVTTEPPYHPRLVINATPLGLHGEALPDRWMGLRGGQVALDLTYGPAPSPFLAAARRGGAVAHDGLDMLVAQAARSFERWTGRPAPVARMDAAARAAVGR